MLIYLHYKKNSDETEQTAAAQTEPAGKADKTRSFKAARKFACHLRYAKELFSPPNFTVSATALSNLRFRQCHGRVFRALEHRPSDMALLLQ